jgi:hypothetical protein
MISLGEWSHIVSFVVTDPQPEFTAGSQVFNYMVMSSIHDPIGESINIGDLHTNTTTQTTWVFYDGVWTPSSTSGEVQSLQQKQPAD